MKRHTNWLSVFSFLVVVTSGTTFLYYLTGGNSPTATHADTPGISADCSTDVTSALNSYLAGEPNGAAITFTANGCYAVNGTLLLQDRQNLTLNGNGATFKTTAATNQPLWKIVGGSNITMTNMTVQGSNPQGKYVDANEFGHNFAINGANGVTLNGVHGRNAYGDFVDIGPDTRHESGSAGNGAVMANNIIVENSDSNITGRNGVSCTGCQNVTVTHNSFSNNGYEGFDLELEASSWFGRNISVTNNTYGVVHLADFNASGAGSDTTNVTFSNNTVTQYNQTCQPAVVFDASTPHKTVTISNNTLLGLRTGISVSNASNVIVSGNKVKISGAGCSNLVGIYGTKLDTGKASGNDFTGSNAKLVVFSGAQPVTNFTACGNRVPNDVNFDKPTTCTTPPTGGGTGGGSGSGSGGGGTTTPPPVTPPSGGSVPTGSSSGKASGGVTTGNTVITKGTSSVATSTSIQSNQQSAKSSPKPGNVATAIVHPKAAIKTIAAHPLQNLTLIGEVLMVLLAIGSGSWFAWKRPNRFLGAHSPVVMPTDADRFGVTPPTIPVEQPPEDAPPFRDQP